MTFKHKLSVRLALLKHRLLLIPLAAPLLACERPYVSAPNPGAVTRVVVSPRQVTLSTSQTSQFMAFGLTATGDTSSAPVTWRATGGSIVDTFSTGPYHYANYQSSTVPGNYLVIATDPPAETLADTGIVSVIPTGTHTGFYVTPYGSPNGDGTAAQPWDLATALAQSTAVPGDTIWLRGGTYLGAFTSSLTGTATTPIIVRQYPGERATINGTMTINGAYTWYWGFEIANTNPNTANVTGLNSSAPGSKFINLVLHDHSGVGIGVWEQAPDAEVYGCIIYYNGFTGSNPGVSYGHGIYTQNNTGTKLLKDNIVFDNYGYGFHLYGENGAVRNYTVDGGVAFDNLSGDYLLRSGNLPVTNNVIRNGMTYNIAGGGVTFGTYYSVNLPDQQDIVVTNNYFSGARVLMGRWQTATFTGNTLRASGQLELDQTVQSAFAPSRYTWDNNDYLMDTRFCGGACPFVTLDGSGNGTSYQTLAQWSAATGLDVNSSGAQTSDGKPASNVIFVRPNGYERGRANIIVYNWLHQSSVTVDLSGVLRDGDQYNVYNVQTLFAPPVFSDTYHGGAITIPITAVTAPRPLGSQVRPGMVFPSTALEFQVFVVRLAGQ